MSLAEERVVRRLGEVGQCDLGRAVGTFGTSLVPPNLQGVENCDVSGEKRALQSKKTGFRAVLPLSERTNIYPVAVKSICKLGS